MGTLYESILGSRFLLFRFVLDCLAFQRYVHHNERALSLASQTGRMSALDCQLGGHWISSRSSRNPPILLSSEAMPFKAYTYRIEEELTWLSRWDLLDEKREERDTSCK